MLNFEGCEKEKWMKRNEWMKGDHAGMIKIKKRNASRQTHLVRERSDWFPWMIIINIKKKLRYLRTVEYLNYYNIRYKTFHLNHWSDCIFSQVTCFRHIQQPILLTNIQNSACYWFDIQNASIWAKFLVLQMHSGCSSQDEFLY